MLAEAVCYSDVIPILKESRTNHFEVKWLKLDKGKVVSTLILQVIIHVDFFIITQANIFLEFLDICNGLFGEGVEPSLSIVGIIFVKFYYLLVICVFCGSFTRIIFLKVNVLLK